MLNIFSAIGSRLTHGTPRHTRSRRTNMDGAGKWKAISANTRGHEHPFPYSTTMLKPPDTFPKPSNWRNKQNPFLPGVSARCSFSRLTMLTPEIFSSSPLIHWDDGSSLFMKHVCSMKLIGVGVCRAIWVMEESIILKYKADLWGQTSTGMWSCVNKRMLTKNISLQLHKRWGMKVWDERKLLVYLFFKENLSSAKPSCINVSGRMQSMNQATSSLHPPCPVLRCMDIKFYTKQEGGKCKCQPLCRLILIVLTQQQ